MDDSKTLFKWTNEGAPVDLKLPKAMNDPIGVYMGHTDREPETKQHVMLVDAKESKFPSSHVNFPFHLNSL